jgi:1,4-dihydroxy-2-naphthoate octaprenyltransferase
MTPKPQTQPACRPSARAASWNFLVHLRLPFQLVLAPFMLWGAALARTLITTRFMVAFVVLHVCFYGGTTAFNSHYDRDEGPVGGLANPPPAGPWLLPGSLLLQGLGLATAAWVGLAFFAVCAGFALLGFLYSHPWSRWKGDPWRSWFVVMVGQGMLGTAAGVVLHGRAEWTPEIGWGLLAAAITVGGIYPLTQLFQIDEDHARGDRTTAIALGRRGTRWAAAALLATGAVTMALSARAGGHTLDSAILGAAALPLVAGAAWVSADGEVSRTYWRVSRFQMAAGGAFALYAVLRICRS